MVLPFVACEKQCVKTDSRHALWRERALSIAVTVDPELPVPPLHYGGIERMVDMLVRGLTTRGHQITVFAHPGSTTVGRLVAWPGRTSRSRIHTALNAAALTGLVASGHFDLIHSFSRVAYLVPVLPMRIPKLMTYQRDISRRSVRLGHALSRGTLWFSAISQHLARGVANIGTWRLIFNGVRLATYDFGRKTGPDAPLVFLGRVEKIKGPHVAIEIACRAGVPLVIAGNVSSEHRSFFETEIKPWLDGNRITYVGPVDDGTKNALLSRARALLMPILWEEPFGIVMVEAMACGTPVIGFARGAVPEVVEHGITGLLGDTIDDLVAAVSQINTINREECRLRVERLFSDRVIVDAYEKVYFEMLAASRGQARA
jgi:glycosyltransferase involved in cell wall biosynthesis